MKLILCTLAVCLSILTSIFTTQSLVRAEGKRTRASLAKTLEEPAGAAGIPDSIPKRLEAINSQLATLNRRMSALEETVRPVAAVGAAVDPSAQSDLLAIRRELSGIAASLARFNGLPGHLAELTTYLGQSFEHVEKVVAEKAAPEAFAPAFDGMAQKLDAIDSYFTPLYAFLGLAYDPSNVDLIAAYPSLDERINALYLQQEVIREDIAALRQWLTPRNIDPVKRPR